MTSLGIELDASKQNKWFNIELNKINLIIL